MVKVEMPRADWDSVIFMLEMYERAGFFVKPVLKEISDQVYSQEY